MENNNYGLTILKLRDSRAAKEDMVNFSDPNQVLLPSNFAHTGRTYEVMRDC